MKFTTYLKPCVYSKSLVFFVVLSSYSFFFCAGTLPGEGSFSMHSLLANHYLYGASYPRGGASEIAFHIIPVIEKVGGKVLVRANVSKILVDEGSGKVQGKSAYSTVSLVVVLFLPIASENVFYFGHLN